MSSNGPSERALLDLDRDMTTAEDVRVLRELRLQTPGWLNFTAEEIDSILPGDALARRPITPAGRPPFSLEQASWGASRPRCWQAIVPIPGTTRLHRLEENIAATAVDLTAEDLREIDRAAAQITQQGARYPEHMQRMVGR